MKKWKYGVLVTALVFSSAIVGCTKQDITKSNQKQGKSLKVVTTFYPMYDFTKNVVGSNGKVDMLIPAGTEPHDFEPSPKDIAKIENADVFVYNSDSMETWVPKVLKNLDNKKIKVVDASKGISLMKGTTEDAEDKQAINGQKQLLDPHVWLDPVLAQKEVENIKQAITEVNQIHKRDYEENASLFTEKLQDLDYEFSKTLSNAKHKEFVTQHAAFAYLAKEYGLTQIPIAGLTPNQEPSPAKLAELQKYVNNNNVKIIYFEEVASPKIAKTLADETGAKTVVLSPIEGITNAEQSKGIDYISYMKKNLDALKQSII
ncbi:zinc ABC transporter substrate-binding protein (plasmid) [Bacillus sp. JAS24-2]|uniref:metal ABC transporter substrate-binding protein n=1 Tax=Bacillus sp. JAS24-2 TaxID=2217832 RepID=UPI0011F0397C|nr:metal ABC transporter substrate-binding protein [Bacillus sp. JAS24-2]QEL82883.1 zinc ABC transporter substrate-binding protein [Bacillus sp. JAS24-2]